MTTATKVQIDASALRERIDARLAEMGKSRVQMCIDIYGRSDATGQSRGSSQLYPALKGSARASPIDIARWAPYLGISVVELATRAGIDPEKVMAVPKDRIPPAPIKHRAADGKAKAKSKAKPAAPPAKAPTSVVQMLAAQDSAIPPALVATRAQNMAPPFAMSIDHQGRVSLKLQIVDAELDIAGVMAGLNDLGLLPRAATEPTRLRIRYNEPRSDSK